MDGPFPEVSLKHLPAGNLHRVPVVHTVWGKHTLCKWFFFWNRARTTRNGVLMATVSAKANGCCVCLHICALHCMCFVHVCACESMFTSPLTVNERRETLKCKETQQKTVNKEKVCLALHISVNSQRQFGKGRDVRRELTRLRTQKHSFYSWTWQSRPCLSSNRRHCK